MNEDPGKRGRDDELTNEGETPLPRRKKQKISLRQLQLIETTQLDPVTNKDSRAVSNFSEGNSSQVDHSDNGNGASVGHGHGEEDDDYFDATSIDGTQKIVLKIIRTLILKCSTDKAIRRKTITDLSKGFPFNEIYSSVNKSLQQTFGLKLQESKSLKGVTKYFLVNCLTTKEKDILNELWPDTKQVHEHNKTRITDHEYFLAKYSRDTLPSDNSELVKTGILAIILSNIIIEDNHLSKLSLINIMQRFGLTNDVYVKNSNINTNLDGILTELERKEYIKRENLQNASDEYIFFNLGDRALMEFTPLAFYDLVKNIYRGEFNSSIGKKVINTLHTSYKMSVEDLEILINQGGNGDQPSNQPPPDHQFGGDNSRDSPPI